MPVWESEGVLPDEFVPPGNDERPHLYGMPRWRDMFMPRQLLAHGCFVEEYRKLMPEVREAYHEDPNRADAVLTLLAMIHGKGLAYNSRQSRWDQSRQKIASTFDIHAFPFRTTFRGVRGRARALPVVLVADARRLQGDRRAHRSWPAADSGCRSGLNPCHAPR